MKIDTNDPIQLVDIDLLRVELKRLYAIEDATKPFTSRAEVETYLKRKGFTEVWRSTKKSTVQFEIEEEELVATFGDDFELKDTLLNDVKLAIETDLLTPALLDAILEAK